MPVLNTEIDARGFANSIAIVAPIPRRPSSRRSTRPSFQAVAARTA